jgi:hypothetical protein
MNASAVAIERSRIGCWDFIFSSPVFGARSVPEFKHKESARDKLFLEGKPMLA